MSIKRNLGYKDRFTSIFLLILLPLTALFALGATLPAFLAVFKSTPSMLKDAQFASENSLIKLLGAGAYSVIAWVFTPQLANFLTNQTVTSGRSIEEEIKELALLKNKVTSQDGKNVVDKLDELIDASCQEVRASVLPHLLDKASKLRTLCWVHGELKANVVPNQHNIVKLSKVLQDIDDRLKLVKSTRCR